MVSLKILQPTTTLLLLRSLDEEAKVVVVGVLLGYWSSAGELLRQLQDVHGTIKAKNNQPLPVLQSNCPCITRTRYVLAQSYEKSDCAK